MVVGAIIAAAGSGTRLGMGSKALVRLRGRTAVARAVELFCSVEEVDRIVVVGPAGELEIVRREVESLNCPKPVHVCPGGDTRQQSVRSGLVTLAGCDYVLVHDAARPMASPELVRRVLAAALDTGASFPGLRPNDAVKSVEQGWLVASLDRARLVLAQTPQAFSYEILVRAHFEAFDAGVVADDDAQLVAAAGHSVAVVEGEPANLKLTTSQDLRLLEALLPSPTSSGGSDTA